MELRRFMSLALAILVGLALVGDRSFGEPRPAGSSPSSPRLTLEGASPAQQARVVAAVTRFEELGLTLPDVALTFADEAADCRGKHGWFQPGEPARITVCSDLAYVVTHELAHAWLEVNLDADDRAAYLDARGLAAWNDGDLEWHHRGIEDAAFVVQQNLMITRHVTLNELWLGRAAAYELLTGEQSPLQFERASAF